MRSVEEIKEMIHANRKMQEILSRRDSAPASLSFIREIDDFVAGSGERVGCILATDCNPEYSLTDIRKVYQDQTGYECCCNEFYICPEEIDGHYAWTIRTLLDRFVRNLEKKYPGEIFCPICSVDLQEELDGITARFHLYREGEFYICKDLEGFPEPVLYCIFGAPEVSPREHESRKPSEVDADGESSGEAFRASGPGSIRNTSRQELTGQGGRDDERPIH